MTFDNVDLMTAIVTPFDDLAERIDFKRLEDLINHLISTGSKGFVVGGTTGETPTLTHDEKIELFTRSAQIINERVP